MKFLIIIPTHNEEKNILFCLESLKKQTFRDYKIVVVNDGSTDQTQAIVNEFAAAHPDFEIENLEISAKNNASAGLNVDNEMKGNLENTSKLIFYGEPINKLTKKDKAAVENRKFR